MSPDDINIAHFARWELGASTAVRMYRTYCTFRTVGYDTGMIGVHFRYGSATSVQSTVHMIPKVNDK